MQCIFLHCCRSWTQYQGLLGRLPEVAAHQLLCNAFVDRTHSEPSSGQHIFHWISFSDRITRLSLHITTVKMTAPVVFGTTGTIPSLLDTAILPRFLELPQSGKIAVEYVWIGGSGSDLRSKTRVLDKIPKGPEDLPVWNYDGSSTGQAPGMDYPFS